jgi:hypothetical protein
LESGEERWNGIVTPPVPALHAVEEEDAAPAVVPTDNDDDDTDDTDDADDDDDDADDDDDDDGAAGIAPIVHPLSLSSLNADTQALSAEMVATKSAVLDLAVELREVKQEITGELKEMQQQLKQLIAANCIL